MTLEFVNELNNLKEAIRDLQEQFDQYDNDMYEKNQLQQTEIEDKFELQTKKLDILATKLLVFEEHSETELSELSKTFRLSDLTVQ